MNQNKTTESNKTQAAPCNIDNVSHRFNIILENGEVILDVKKLSNKSEITKETKLYYELGYYDKTIHYTKDHKAITHANIAFKDSEWVRTGKFKEIKDPIEFRDSDDRFDEKRWIKHHNFVINGG